MKRSLPLILAAILALIGAGWYLGLTMIEGSLLPKPPNPLTQPVKMFSISYGEGANNLGVFIPEFIPEEGLEGELPLGPSRLLIASDGTLWFADKVNEGRLKQFSRTGQLLRQVFVGKPSISEFAVGTDGYVYVCHEVPSKFAVFDPQGKPKPDIAERLTKAIRSVGSEICFFRLCIDNNNNLYGQSFIAGRQVTLKITQAGEMEILPGGSVDRKGRIWGVQRLEDKEVSIKVYEEEDGTLHSFEYERSAFVQKRYTVYDEKGKVIRQFNLPSGEMSEIERSVTEGSINRFDGRGHLYTLVSPLTVQWKTLVGILRLCHWKILLEYNGDGKFIGVRALLAIPDFQSVGPDDLWDVDEAGNVYYLDFKADRVDVMMAPVP